MFVIWVWWHKVAAACLLPNLLPRLGLSACSSVPSIRWWVIWLSWTQWIIPCCLLLIGSWGSLRFTSWGRGCLHRPSRNWIHVCSAISPCHEDRRPCQEEPSGKWCGGGSAVPLKSIENEIHATVWIVAFWALGCEYYGVPSIKLSISAELHAWGSIAVPGLVAIEIIVINCGAYTLSIMVWTCSVPFK